MSRSLGYCDALRPPGQHLLWLLVQDVAAE